MLKHIWANGDGEDLAERDAYIAQYPDLIEFLDKWGQKALDAVPSLALEASYYKEERHDEAPCLELIFDVMRDEALYDECSYYEDYVRKVKNPALEEILREMRAWLENREKEPHCPEWVYYAKVSIYY